MLSGIAILVLVILLLLAFVGVLVVSSLRPTEPNDSYISDQEYLESGGVIRYHAWGKTRE